MNYDEAIKDLSQLISTTCDGERLLAKVKSAIITAKKEHAELAEIKKRAEKAKDIFMNADGKPLQYNSLTSEQSVNLIDFILKGETK